MGTTCVRILGLIVSVLILAVPARGDEVGVGDLFAVFANSGEFGDGSILDGQDYTVVHFMSFAPSPDSTFPEPLVPQSFPAFESGLAVDLPTTGGSQFFLIGGIQPSNHLLLSNSNPGAVPSDLFTQSTELTALHDQLVIGASSLAAGGPMSVVSAFDFWAGMGVEAMDFFGLQAKIGNNGAVVELFAGTDPLAAVGSEEIFGFGQPLQTGSVDFSISEGALDSLVYQVGTNGEVFEAQPIPEPGSLVLLSSAAGVFLLVARRRRARRRAA